eukprot:scaffold91525_cov19-Tisochrysis_lutea.AAC.1
MLFDPQACSLQTSRYVETEPFHCLAHSMGCSRPSHPLGQSPPTHPADLITHFTNKAGSAGFPTHSTDTPLSAESTGPWLERLLHSTFALPIMDATATDASTQLAAWHSAARRAHLHAAITPAYPASAAHPRGFPVLDPLVHGRDVRLVRTLDTAHHRAAMETGAEGDEGMAAKARGAGKTHAAEPGSSSVDGNGYVTADQMGASGRCSPDHSAGNSGPYEMLPTGTPMWPHTVQRAFEVSIIMNQGIEWLQPVV